MIEQWTWCVTYLIGHWTDFKQPTFSDFLSNSKRAPYLSYLLYFNDLFLLFIQTYYLNRKWTSPHFTTIFPNSCLRLSKAHYLEYGRCSGQRVTFGFWKNPGRHNLISRFTDLQLKYLFSTLGIRPILVVRFRKQVARFTCLFFNVRKSPEMSRFANKKVVMVLKRDLVEYCNFSFFYHNRGGIQ